MVDEIGVDNKIHGSEWKLINEQNLLLTANQRTQLLNENHVCPELRFDDVGEFVFSRNTMPCVLVYKCALKCAYSQYHYDPSWCWYVPFVHTCTGNV